MSAREFKPGDVAMIRVPLKTQPGSGRHEQGNGDLPAVHTSSGGWAALDDVDYYWESDYAFHDAEPRPLVVIDPEDMKDVERLHALWCEAIVSKGTSSRQIDSMQAALREFADPKPRIEEPTGLGAVVLVDEIDHEGRWTRARSQDHGMNWRSEYGGRWSTYSDLNVVRVLSEGVTS